MTRLSYLCAAVLAAGMLAPAAAQQDRAARCAREAIADDLAAKIAHQTALRDLIAGAAPRHRDLADLNMNLQIALAKTRRAKAAYVSRHDPARLKIDQGLEGLRGFDWSEAEDAALAAEDGEYKALRQSVARLRARNNDHPGWPDMRAVFRDTIAKRGAYADLMAEFSRRQGEIDTRLARCLEQ